MQRLGCGDSDRKLKKRHAFNAQVDVVNGIAGGEDGGAKRRKGYADEVGAGEGERGFAGGGDADQAAAAVEAGCDVDVAVFGEREALGTAEAAIPDGCFAVGVDGPDGVVGVEGGGGDEKNAFGIDGEVIGGDGRLKRGVDEDLALRIDFEYGAAAVADEEVALGIKGCAGGHAHAFGIHG